MFNFKNILVCGASGQMAILLVSEMRKQYGDSLNIYGIDLIKPAADFLYNHFKVMDINHLSNHLENNDFLTQADLVLLCLPDQIVLKILPNFLKVTSSNTLIIETLSVKTPFYNALSLAQKENKHISEILSIHTLFRPNLGLQDNNIAYIVSNGKKYDSFLDLLSKAGSKLFEISIEEHDSKMALIQVATHSMILIYGLLLHELNYDIESNAPFWTPPHRHILQLLARIVGDMLKW